MTRICSRRCNGLRHDAALLREEFFLNRSGSFHNPMKFLSSEAGKWGRFLEPVETITNQRRTVDYPAV